LNFEFFLRFVFCALELLLLVVFLLHIKLLQLKTLLLIRHAKSDWDAGIASDFDRPLNERGKRDAPLMAHRLLDQNRVPDLLVASPAKRAAKTARLFAATFKQDKDSILYKPELYLAEPPAFFSVIQELDNQFGQAAIFAHNPGITSMANLVSQARIDDMPTCSIFGIKIQCDSWADFVTAPKEFWFFDYPKA
jgi:phosphohistidine phosphatase